jgi:hypothetical protein
MVVTATPRVAVTAVLAAGTSAVAAAVAVACAQEEEGARRTGSKQ